MARGPVGLSHCLGGQLEGHLSFHSLLTVVINENLCGKVDQKKGGKRFYNYLLVICFRNPLVTVNNPHYIGTEEIKITDDYINAYSGTQNIHLRIQIQLLS